MFKEYKLPKEGFIGGWFISSKICKNLISYYNEFNSNAQLGMTTGKKVNKKIKHSYDLNIGSRNTDKEVCEYRHTLQKLLDLYIKRYPELSWYERFNFTEANIQKYPKKGGFKKWHFERALKRDSTRVLVFMTYLNNVEQGGTHFKYQKIITPAKEGLTLIWPTDFTHTHKGQIATEEKIIITGWFSLL